MRWVGRGVTAVGAALLLTSLWVKYNVGGYKNWDDGTYGAWYLTMTLVVVAIAVLAAVTRRRTAAFVAMVIALVLLGGSIDSFVYISFHYTDLSTGFWLQPIGGLLLAAGALLTYLAWDADYATFPAVQSTAAPVSAEPAPPTPEVPAGWYPDPSGTARQRYWDGRQWTSQTAS